jgi:hypothetical protein
VLNAVLRKVTIRRVDKEGGDATEGILQLRTRCRDSSCEAGQRETQITEGFFGVHIGKGELGSPPFCHVFFSRRNV